MLVRRRLLRRLRDRWIAPVTVVTAPGGYGKTTLLAQAIAANDAAPLGIECWMACRPAAGAATVLGAEICAALGVAAPGDGRESQAEVVAAVTEAMWRRSPQQVALLLDDVHEIPPGSEAAALLAAVVAELPANGHVVLAGRMPPELPLARLEVDGHVVRLGETDLAFTEDEVAEFAALRGVPGTVVAMCGGWPALAELYANARAHAADDYLREEVLTGSDPTARRQLALLAHLGRFDDELARAALDTAVDVPALLAGVPLVTSSGRGEWTLHPLWRRYLADDVTPTETAAARRRAARVLLRRRAGDEAIPLLLEAEAWDDLAEAIVVVFGAAHPSAPHEAPARWYAQLPPDVRAAPSGQLLAAVAALDIDTAADAVGAWQRFEDCALAFRAAGHAAGEVACLVQLARLAWWSEQPELLGGLAVRVLELEATGGEDVVALACIGRALLCDLKNDNRRLLAELDRIPPGSLSEAWEGVAVWLRSVALLQLGDADGALAMAERALTYTGDLHVLLAEATRLQALWLRGRTAEATDGLSALLARFRKLGFRSHIAIAEAQAAVTWALLGDADQAADHLARARASALAPDAPLVDTNVSLAEAALAVARGDEASAAAIMTSCLNRHPLAEGLSAGAHLRNLALIYVLVPASRAACDDADLGPAFRVARDLARALTGIREHQRLPADAPPLQRADVVRAHMPSRWIAELGVSAVAAGRDDGWDLLDATWPASRPAVLGLAETAARSVRRAANVVLGRLPVPPTERLELRLLGPVELRRAGLLVDAPEWRRERVRVLLIYLVLLRTTSRQRLAAVLWPDLDPDAAASNLRVTLTYLRRVLEPDRGRRDPSFFVRQHGGTLALHPGEWLTVDLWEFDGLCDLAGEADRNGSPAAALDHALQAAELWRSEPAELLAEPWAVGEVEQRRRRFAAIATRAGELLLATGNVDGPLALAERALAVDPWLEAAHRLVVAAHRANGDALAARRALGRYRAVVDDLGFTPGEATLMVERLLERLTER